MVINMSVLLITDVFPPDPGGRAEKMYRHVKYLNRNEIDVDVLCPVTRHVSGHHPIDGIRGQCWRVKPFLWKQLASLVWQERFAPRSPLGCWYVRRGLPGGYIRWFIPALFFARKLVCFRKIKVVVAVSNPITNQILGIALANSVPQLKLFSELRDPIVGYYGARHSHFTMQFIEALVAKYADRIVEWEDFCPKPMVERHPGIANKYTRIANAGYDEDEYKDYNPEILYKKELTIVYTGGYYGEKELWRLFLGALSEMVNAGMPIHLDYYGTWAQDQESIRNTLPDRGKPWLSLHGRVPKATCITASQNAHALLYLLKPHEENMARISSKVYDYLASRRPILALLPRESLVEKKISEFCSDYILSLGNEWEQHLDHYQEWLLNLLAMLYSAQTSNKLSKFEGASVEQYKCMHAEKQWVSTISDLIKSDRN